MPIISAIRWPPDPGTVPITGPNLADTYQHYFGTKFPAPPPQLTDPYEISNWRDCKMTAALGTRWQRGELRSERPLAVPLSSLWARSPRSAATASQLKQAGEDDKHQKLDEKMRQGTASLPIVGAEKAGDGHDSRQKERVRRRRQDRRG